MYFMEHYQTSEKTLQPFLYAFSLTFDFLGLGWFLIMIVTREYIFRLAKQNEDFGKELNLLEHKIVNVPIFSTE